MDTSDFLLTETHLIVTCAQVRSARTVGGIDVVITKAHVFPSEDPTKNPGAILVIKEARTLAVQTGNGTLFIEKLKPAGKAQMDAASFINGYGKNL